MAKHDVTSGGTEAASTATARVATKRRSRLWLDLLKAIALPLVTLVLGYVFNASINARQTRDTNIRLYTEMMGRREESDSALRKDMFNSILSTFMSKDPKLLPGEQLDQHILSLELLAYNFHEALDLGPLFKHVRGRILKEKKYGELHNRISRLTQEVIDRQLTLLSDTGMVTRGDVSLDEDRYVDFSGVEPDSSSSRGASIICMSMASSDGVQHHRLFGLEVSRYDPQWREIEVQLDVSEVLTDLADCQRADPSYLRSHLEIHTKFWVGAFDFPMIDNVRLKHGERCAVSLAQMTNADTMVTAKIAVTYFPGSRASLKEKPYYDDLLHDLKEGLYLRGHEANADAGQNTPADTVRTP